MSKRKNFKVDREDVDTLGLVVGVLKEAGAPPALLMQVIMALLTTLGILNAAEANMRRTFGTEEVKPPKRKKRKKSKAPEVDEDDEEEPERVATEDWDGIEMAANAAKLGPDDPRVELVDCKVCAGPLLRAQGDIRRHAGCDPRVAREVRKAAKLAKEAAKAAKGAKASKSGKPAKNGKRCQICDKALRGRQSVLCGRDACHKARNADRMRGNRAARA